MKPLVSRRRRLTLDTSTLRNLSADQLDLVAGGRPRLSQFCPTIPPTTSNASVRRDTGPC